MAAPTVSLRPNLAYERGLLLQGYVHIAGVDEVGRGSLAGPVVAAAVMLPVRSQRQIRRLDGVRDSKQLTPGGRSRLFEVILEVAIDVGIGWASHHVIDAEGMSYANRHALHRAVQNLRVDPDAILVDHFRLPECPLPQVAITRGDACSLSIAAASIVAKVVRDRWMTRCESRFPGYGFADHKGYGTRRHRDAIRDLGPCPVHRKTFAPIAAYLL